MNLDLPGVDSVLSFDTETAHGKPFLFQFCRLSNAKPRAIRLGKSAPWCSTAMPPARACAAVRDTLRGNSGDRLVGHNIKYDLAALEALGIRISRADWDRADDTAVMARLLVPPWRMAAETSEEEEEADEGPSSLDPARFKERSISLKSLARRFLRDPCLEAIAVQKWVDDRKARNKAKKAKGAEVDWSDMPPGLLLPYALKDPVLALKLYCLWRSRIGRSPGLERTYQREMEIQPILLDMERRGVQVAEGNLRTLWRSAVRRRNAAQRRIYEILGEVNLRSSQAVAKAFFACTEAEPLHFTRKTVKPSISADCLADYRRPEWPRAVAVLDALAVLRPVQRYLSTYYRPILCPKDSAEPLSVVHTTFCSWLPRTGRLSSARPNLQNLPRNPDKDRPDWGPRAMFGPRPGFEWITIDLSQVELRIPAALIGRGGLWAAFKRGEKPHVITTTEIFGSCGGSSDPNYTVGKTCNFALIYGCSAPRLRDILRSDSGISLTPGRAVEIREKWMKVYPEVPEFWRSVEQKVRRWGYVETVFGRRIYAETRESRDAVNFLVQGTAADLLKEAMPRVEAVARRYGGHLLLNVHDELVAEVPKGIAARHAKEFVEAMEDHDTFSIPILAEAKVCREHWAKKEDVK